jgi:hypothetical protein
MRFQSLKCLIIVALALSSDPIAKTAFAVASSKVKAAATAPTILPGQITSKKIELPVTWQLTRSRMIGADSSTVTETYRETWILEIQNAGILHLRSPRAVVPIFVSEEAQQVGENVPTNLTMSESDFGKLIGVKHAENEIGNLPAIDRPVTIQLMKGSRQDSEILLTWSDDEHFIVQLDFSPIATF